MGTHNTHRNKTVKHVPKSYSWGAVDEITRQAHDDYMQNLKRIRKARGLSQQQLAEMCACSQGMISRMEIGTANPTLDLIERVAHALRTTPVALFGLPDFQQRLIEAVDSLPPARREAALQFLEAMSGSDSAP